MGTKKGSMSYIGLFAAVLVILLSVLAALKMHAISSEISRAALEQTKGTDLCRTLMNLYSSAEDEEEFLENSASLGYLAVKMEEGTYVFQFDEGLGPKKDGAYTARLDVRSEKRAHGSMETLLSSLSVRDEVLVSLESSRYLPEFSQDRKVGNFT